MTHADIQHQGRAAFWADKTQSHNPYIVDSQEYKWWLQGYLIEFGRHYFNEKASREGLAS